MNFRFLSIVGFCAAGISSCVDINNSLGSDFLAKNQQYEIYTAEFPIEDIRMENPDELSGVSSYRFTIGAVKDDLFGLTTRSSCFTLVPVQKTLDFGKEGTRVFKQFHFSAPMDTVSCENANQRHIIQLSLIHI